MIATGTQQSSGRQTGVPAGRNERRTLLWKTGRPPQKGWQEKAPCPCSGLWQGRRRNQLALVSFGTLYAMLHLHLAGRTGAGRAAVKRNANVVASDNGHDYA